MTVKELIKKLSEMPEDARVFCVWDGGARGELNCVWLARSGNVNTSDNGQVVYYTEDRPAEAPTTEEDHYWETPED